MQKRERYFNATQTMDLDFAKRWLGLFQPVFPCPKPERLGDYGDGGKVSAAAAGSGVRRFQQAMYRLV